MGNLLTMADIARTLELPESTVRYYRDRFTEFIPAVGVGRNRRYRPEALDVLRFIADAMKEGMPAEGVRTTLAAKFAINVEPQQPTAAIPQQYRNQQQQPTAAILRSVIAELTANAEEALLEVAAETATLRNQQQQLHQELEAANQCHQEALERLCQQQAAQLKELQAMIEERLPLVEVKRRGLITRVRNFLGRDKQKDK